MKYRVYIFEEDDSDPTMPASKDWRKVGHTEGSQGGNPVDDDNFHQRQRALNQGNPRGMVSVGHGVFDTKKEATKCEDEIFKQVKARGYQTRNEITGKTGHKEWTNMPRDEIKKIIEDCEKSTKIDKDIYDGLFKESLVVHL